MRKPIRLCILTTLFYLIVGGAETHNRALVERLIEREIDVFVITRRTEAKLKSQELVGKILVFRLPPTGFKRSSKSWLQNYSGLHLTE